MIPQDKSQGESGAKESWLSSDSSLRLNLQEMPISFWQSILDKQESP